MAPKEGDRAFLRFDSPARGRVLEPGVVEGAGDGVWTLVFETRHHAVETGAQRVVYYNKARDFIEQLVLIESQSSGGPPYVLTVKPLGDAVSANSRSEDRVVVGDCELMAALDDEPNCPIQDVSLSGLSVLSDRRHRIGRSLEVAIWYGDEEFVGEMEVQGAAVRADGKTRYGLLGVFDSPQGRNLKNGLTKMTLEIQQQRLRRISSSN